jgi:hypothetical protein
VGVTIIAAVVVSVVIALISSHFRCIYIPRCLGFSTFYTHIIVIIITIITRVIVIANAVVITVITVMAGMAGVLMVDSVHSFEIVIIKMYVRSMILGMRPCPRVDHRHSSAQITLCRTNNRTIAMHMIYIWW